MRRGPADLARRKDVAARLLADDRHQGPFAARRCARVPDPTEFDSMRTSLYNNARMPRVYPLIGGGVAEWLKAAVC